MLLEEEAVLVELVFFDFVFFDGTVRSFARAAGLNRGEKFGTYKG